MIVGLSAVLFYDKIYIYAVVSFISGEERNL